VILALLFIPVFAGAAAFSLRADRLRRGLLLGTALAHTGLTLTAWSRPPAPAFSAWLALDAPGLLFLSITSVLFLAAAFYGVGYLQREAVARRDDDEAEPSFFSNAPEAVFTGCVLLFLATMTLVSVAQHFGLLWVAVEATTLASAPLIYFHRHQRSLEATWKYLVICSVGIALALLGNFCLSVAASWRGVSGEGAEAMLLRVLLRDAGGLQTSWLKAAFLCLLVGYGTKMGLAPLHTWLPDAHSEAPSVISALLSGALLNCAFLAILRAQQVLAAAGLAAFGQDLLVGFGLLSMLIAAVFIVGQVDFKRLLAYSSVEHMGILALGVGLGGGAVFGAVLHTVNHSLTKAMLFLVAGNLLAVYQTKTVARVQGALRVVPASALLWIAGILAITGTPPFGPFLSELTILKGALDQGRYATAATYLVALAVIFIGMATIMLNMTHGGSSLAARPDGPVAEAAAARREPLSAIVPPLLLGVVVLMLGFYIPASVSQALHAAARALGGW
jgi:hydrogenase-4 component F